MVERFGAVGDSLAGLLRMVVGDAARARDEDDSRSRRSGRSFGPRGCCWPRQIGGAGDSEDWDWDDGASGGVGSDDGYGCVLARLDSVGRARLRSAAGQCAGRWLEAMPTHHRLRASAQHFSLKVVRSSTLHDVMDAGAPCPRTVDVVLLYTGCHLTLAHCTLLRMLATERVADCESLRAAACW